MNKPSASKTCIIISILATMLVFTACHEKSSIEDECTDSSCISYQPKCPNSIVDEGEACDGNNFGGKTCADFGGFAGGILSCTNSCQLDFSHCYECTNDDKSRCEPGESCVGGLCVNQARCGDGIVNQDNELCDGKAYRDDKINCSDWDSQYVSGELTCTKDCRISVDLCLRPHGCLENQVWIESESVCAYSINTAEDLIVLHDKWNKYGDAVYATVGQAKPAFILNNDINLGALDKWQGIGNDNSSKLAFNGTFLGNGKTIKGTLNRGLFFHTNQAVIKDLKIVINLSDELSTTSGALAHILDETTVSNLEVSGTSSFGPEIIMAAGVVGLSRNSTINKLSWDGSMTLDITDFGWHGIVIGSADHTEISEVTLNGSVKLTVAAEDLIEYYFGTVAGLSEYSNYSDIQIHSAVTATQKSANDYNYGHISEIAGMISENNNFERIINDGTYNLSTTFKTADEDNAGIAASALCGDASECKSCKFDQIQSKAVYSLKNVVSQDLVNRGRRISLSNSSFNSPVTADSTSVTYSSYNNCSFIENPSLTGINIYYPGSKLTLEKLNGNLNSDDIPTGKWLPWIENDGQPALKFGASEAELIVKE